jgi:hypothetical protein
MLNCATFVEFAQWVLTFVPQANDITLGAHTRLSSHHHWASTRLRPGTLLTCTTRGYFFKFEITRRRDSDAVWYRTCIDFATTIREVHIKIYTVCDQDRRLNQSREGVCLSDFGSLSRLMRYKLSRFMRLRNLLIYLFRGPDTIETYASSDTEVRPGKPNFLSDFPHIYLYLPANFWTKFWQYRSQVT